MRRKELKKLGLDKAIIDSVMDLHQIDAEKNKKILNIKNQVIITLEKQIINLLSELRDLTV